jgi:hypothetical protein
MVTLVVVAGIVAGSGDVAGRLTYSMDFPTAAACERAVDQNGDQLQNTLERTLHEDFKGALAALDSYTIRTRVVCRRL